MYPNSIQTLNASTDILGYVLRSPAEQSIDSVPHLTALPMYNSNNNIDLTNFKYDHSLSLSSSYDLQIAKGAFRTKTNVDAYQNYTTYTNNSSINYSGINGYRYCTMAWKCPTDGLQYNRLTFKINTVDNTTITDPDDGANFPKANSIPIYVFYKFENLGDRSTFGGNFTLGQVNTTWVNATIESTNTIQAIGSTNYYQTDKVRGGKDNTPGKSNSYTNGVYTINALLPTAFRMISSNNYVIYFRLAVSLDSNFSFTHVTCKLS
jgi:hypothetical protein